MPVRVDARVSPLSVPAKTLAPRGRCVPVFAPPERYMHSPHLHSPGRPLKRTTLAYFSGNLAHGEPKKYARGVRHRGSVPPL